VERVCSREGREEDVGVEIWGMRRPFTEVSRGLAIVDIVCVVRVDVLLFARHWTLLLSGCAEVRCEIEETLTSNVDEAASEPCVHNLRSTTTTSHFQHRFLKSQ